MSVTHRSRRTARRLALDVLYEAEIRDDLPLEAWASRSANGWIVPSEDETADPSAPEKEPESAAIEYARVLVAGVQDHAADIDALIARYADHWTIQRMPVVDRNVLRVALFELLWRTDVPVPVAINEAVELAKALSTEESGRFVNGLLGRIAEQARQG